MNATTETTIKTTHEAVRQICDGLHPVRATIEGVIQTLLDGAEGAIELTPKRLDNLAGTLQGAVQQLAERTNAQTEFMETNRIQ